MGKDDKVRKVKVTISGKTVGGGRQSGAVSVKVLRRRRRDADEYMLLLLCYATFTMDMYDGYAQEYAVLQYYSKKENSKYCIERPGIAKKGGVGFTRQGNEAQKKESKK